MDKPEPETEPSAGWEAFWDLAFYFIGLPLACCVATLLLLYAGWAVFGGVFLIVLGLWYWRPITKGVRASILMLRHKGFAHHRKQKTTVDRDILHDKKPAA
jgi:ABC-type dipeptide/oligopeptide/nickel transport system permease subunit